MQTAKEFISDYEENKSDIEYWLSIKCEQKYRRFAELLKENGEETTWVNIRDLYRYDKRLIFNCFRYISFLEEYLRAVIVRNSDSKESKYDELQECYLPNLTNQIIELDSQGLFHYNGPCLDKELFLVKELRNCISHNRIVLETDYESEITALRNLLPSNYAKKFVTEINDSLNKLTVSGKWVVSFIS